jgi:predicted nucleic acid-binding protein
MVFVDTNVFMYAVGRAHPLKPAARKFFEEAVESRAMRLCTSAEVVQELLHAYLPVNRLETLDAALTLVRATVDDIWSIEVEDVWLARTLVDGYPALGARDLLHLACCRRRNLTEIKSYDRALSAAVAKTAR